MKKRINLTIVSGSLISLLPMIPSALLYDKLPELVAIHLNTSGVGDNYVPKAIAVFGIPWVFVALTIIINVLGNNGSKEEDISRVMKLLRKWMVPVVAVFVQISILAHALTLGYNAVFYSRLVAGFLIVIIGNYLPKCRRNNIIGIRLPWTLQDADNWNKTHRLAGYLWIVCGLIIMASAFFQISLLMVLPLAVMVTVPGGYSFWLNKTHNIN